MASDFGPIYTKSSSYRARAEARQREYRALKLGADHGQYGHFLTEAAANEGANFVIPEAFHAARLRQEGGKGIAPRIFENMLSSQAMCFNVFAPLQARLPLATKVLKPFVPGLEEIDSIEIEYTPTSDVFRDQSGRGGVDCDLLVQGKNSDGQGLVLVVETKFVEPEFSVCGFRKAGREAKGKEVCPDDVRVHEDRGACLYTRNKGYAYWQRNDEHGLLADGAVPEAGCPFAGPRWQLWVNLALAHEEAKRRGATDARFAVCVSERNEELMGGGKALEDFRALLRRPNSIHHIDLEALLAHIETVAPPELEPWATNLSARYTDI